MQESSAAQYDALPYESHPDPMIHPDRMAAAAWLYGVDAPGVESARVLEIGCGTGAHLIPMAYQLPAATFVGFDFSATQIALAKYAAAAVGLTNIRFEQRDIRAEKSDLGEFDYIIAHGIFSWVPPAIQDALLDLCRRHLSPHGVALVDYNVYPGWHQRELLRDLIAFHKADGADLSRLTAAALDSLNFVAGHLFAPGQPFAQSAVQLQRWAAGHSRNYLAHEFGSSSGHATTFCEFAERAQARQLEILADAELLQVIPEQSAASVAAKLHEVAGSDYFRREQFLDFLRGRDFRRTLLVHDAVPVSRTIIPEALRRLRFTTVARHEPLAEGAWFRTPDGVALRTFNAPLMRSLSALCAAGPAGMAFDDLFEKSGLPPEASTKNPPLAHVTSLLEAVASGVAQIHAHRPRVINHISEKPRANALAQVAAAAGRDVATSLLHRDWRIDSFERQLLPLLDGSHTRSQLSAVLSQQAPGASERQVVEAHLASSLEWFARVGILIG